MVLLWVWVWSSRLAHKKCFCVETGFKTATCVCHLPVLYLVWCDIDFIRSAGLFRAGHVASELAEYCQIFWYNFLADIWSTTFLSGSGKGEQRLDVSQNEVPALYKILFICLGLTWLNPHVYLDTVVLLGSISTQYPNTQLYFALGAITASFLFFFSLGYAARYLQPVFQRPQAWKILDIMIGCVMWSIAILLK